MRTVSCERCEWTLTIEDKTDPGLCPRCGVEGAWRDQHPIRPYRLSYNDRQFLHSLRISSEDA